MFTGIVQGTAEVVSSQHKEQFMLLELALPQTNADNLTLGASIAVNGTCLTISNFQGNIVRFDLMIETLRATNLGELKVGQQVNFERAARFGDEIGGHLLSGHIHDQIEISRIEQPENNHIIWFKAAPQWIRYILPKGFVALNGCSLTIGEVTDNEFNVFLIPETLNNTVFGSARTGQKINLEIDAHTQAIIDTAERYLAQNN